MSLALPFVLVLLVAEAPPTESSLPLDHVADVALPGRASRFDYQAVDDLNRRLYIAHLGDSSLVVYDLDAQLLIAVDLRDRRQLLTLPLPAEIDVLAVDPSTHRVYLPIANLGGRPVLRIMQARVVCPNLDVRSARLEPVRG